MKKKSQEKKSQFLDKSRKKIHIYLFHLEVARICIVISYYIQILGNCNSFFNFRSAVYKYKSYLTDIYILR